MISGLSFVISIVALVLAYLAFQRSGGNLELKSKVEQLGITTDTMRDKLADVLSRMEKAVRGIQTKPSAPPDDHQAGSSSQKDGDNR
ncbi:MAG: hypothetical protein NTV89_12010 [Proteobacteria bacterium]|nr:hypothetical protein [Pseudomonadota bacterium]